MCQRNKGEIVKPSGLLQPLLISNQICEYMSMDFIIRLPKSQGKHVVFVVVDRLTKYAHFCGIQSTYTAIQVE